MKIDHDISCIRDEKMSISLIISQLKVSVTFLRDSHLLQFALATSSTSVDGNSCLLEYQKSQPSLAIMFVIGSVGVTNVPV
jgi:hypothetical protein